MKILILDTYYPAFLEDFYQQKPGLAKQSYRKQLNALLAQQFGTADFYTKNLRALGHDANDIIYNDEHLQKSWACEHGMKRQPSYLAHIPKLRGYLKQRWSEQILLDQIEYFQPDVLYIQNVSVLSRSFLQRIKPSLKMLVGQSASPVSPKTDFSAYDLLISAAPNFVRRFREQGYTSEALKIGFEPSILTKLKKNQEEWGTVFIGGFTGPHLEATRLLEQVAAKVPIDFWGHGEENLNSQSPIFKRFHGSVWGLDMYSVLHNSKIAINRHVNAAENYAGNMRLYEVTGVGTFLITDLKSNLNSLFDIGKEVETYSSAKELIEKIIFYSKHDSAREKIAKAGQERTLKEHTYLKRMQELEIILKKYLK